ncbi:radial spoke head protein 3 homolog B isoform X2 [Hermetia illucens]|uniref:radial spoke head protein 3 homolog B isoform X2 n=1 Tax=Hermetia illucens TaxID=343691 RepID=UPI0018CC5BDB|nr:radial spoke head protein 3 homolog B isoform X2 [Hermetia illucens]
MSTAVVDAQSIEVLPTSTVSKEPVNLVLPDSQDVSNVDFLVSNGQLTTVVSPTQAFQVINHDFLAPAISKPNAIVRPLRRDDPMNDSKLIAYVESQIVKTSPIDQFTKELDTKLRRLKTENKSKSSSKNGSNQENICKRPIFITTVPKGIFLQPPTELRVPSRRVYAYSSKPRIFTNRYGHAKDKCHISRVEKDILNAVAGVRAFTRNHAQNTERETQPSEPYKNIMHDKRVVRGSNFSQLQTIAGEGDCFKEAEARRRNVLRKKVVRNQRGVIGTPPPVCGRKHEDVQTDKYLEELFEKPPEIEIGCQTDLFLYRPPSPPFVPSKVGVDVETQIYDGDLFDFDVEVQPILESLVGHTIEQGLVEILHEEELAYIQYKKEELLALRETDLAEVRRLQAEEARFTAERHRRIRQDSIAKNLDAEMQDKVTAARLLQGHIANLVPAVLKQLEPLNEAENREELERKLCPWLTQQVAEEVGHMIDSREILTAIVKEILLQRAEMYDPDFTLASSEGMLVCVEENDTASAGSPTLSELSQVDEDPIANDYEASAAPTPQINVTSEASDKLDLEQEPEK